MDYTEAVTLALAGDERGYGVLYQRTYQSKYYLAIQYMKNEEAAKDVLQDAYIKAFAKLETLENPEAFSEWLGMIVANTAKNMLKKKNPLLFSDVAVDENDENFEYQIEDENIDNQPETAYTRQETQELVHELIDSLSEEQRVCILMFHIEGASISEIAETLNCSDNTVKSRLNYGRKNLKAKAEELQKKGYKLYSIAPVTLFLYLLHSEETAMAADGTLVAAGKVMQPKIFFPFEAAKGAGVSAVGSAGGNIAGATVKSGFFHTAIGKMTIVLIGTCITGSAVLFGVIQASSKSAEATVQEEIMPEEGNVMTRETPVAEQTAAAEDKAAEETTPEVEEVPSMTEMKEEDYTSLIKGNLTREEIEYVFAYGPQEMSGQGFADSDYLNFLNLFCVCSKNDGNIVKDYGNTSNWASQYSVEDVNRLFSSFTDYQYSEENDSEAEYGINVDGEIIRFFPATPAHEAKAVITAAYYTDTQMDIYYTYDYKNYDSKEEYTKDRIAILKPQEDGKYQIIEIRDASVPVVSDTQTEEQTKPAEDGQSIKSIYEGVLQAVKNQESGYTFPNIGTSAIGYEYFLADINNDGIQELIVGACFEEDVFICHDCRVFSCEKTGSGYALKAIPGEEMSLSLFISGDGNGLFEYELARGTGKVRVYRMGIDTGTLVRQSNAEYQFTMGDDQNNQFANANSVAAWTDISSMDGLSGLG